MEISNLGINPINAYKKYNRTSAAKKSDGAGRAAANTDKIEFDRTRSLNAAQSAIAARVGGSAGEDRLAALAAKYAGDNVPVSSDAVASAMIA